MQPVRSAWFLTLSCQVLRSRPVTQQDILTLCLGALTLCAPLDAQRHCFAELHSDCMQLLLTSGCVRPCAGKGMHSRLYTRVLNQCPWMHNCTAFNSVYNETGVVGIFASAESPKAENCVDVLVKELQVRFRPWTVCGVYM